MFELGNVTVPFHSFTSRERKLVNGANQNLKTEGVCGGKAATRKLLPEDGRGIVGRDGTPVFLTCSLLATVTGCYVEWCSSPFYASGTRE